MPIKKLADGTQYEKATHHTGAKLKGRWEVTYKIDGVRAMRNSNGDVVSRNGKPLYNLDHLEFTDAEIFRKNWETTVSLVRSQVHKLITQDDVYELGYNNYDSRLEVKDWLLDPSPATCLSYMHCALKKGYEGIVLRGEDNKGNAKWIKVVPKLNADLRVTGYKLGTGRLAGVLGSLETNYGSVGSGFDDELRKQLTLDGLDNLIGKIIEVSYREKTPAGKLRFPAFERIRFDKDEESLT